MAGKDEKKEIAEKKKKGGIGKILLIFFAFIVLLLIVFVALLKLDVASLGTKVIGPNIQNIPGASLILPKMPVDEEVLVEGDGTIAYETIDQAVEILKVTENLLKEKEKEAETLIEQIDQLTNENTRLKVFEDNYLQFVEDKAAFDSLIVDQTDPTAFSTWYATMNPENAAKIYEAVIIEEAVDAELNNLVQTYLEMKPDNAAAILTEMSTTRLEMVATIIKHLEADQAAKVLGAMDPVLASRITAYLYPQQ